MASTEKSIVVNVPVHTAYNQWTQFESFPEFMEGIQQVQQLDDKRLHWRANIGGKEEEWDAEIIEQTPDQRIAWRSITGAQNDGMVTFQPVDAKSTRVTVRLDYEPEGVIENIGDALGFVGRRVEGDLERFKQFIESRGSETGAWRGEIHGGQVEQGMQRSVGEGFTATGQASDLDRGTMDMRGASGSEMGASTSDRSGQGRMDTDLGGSADRTTTSPTGATTREAHGDTSREGPAEKVIASMTGGILGDLGDGAAGNMREEVERRVGDLQGGSEGNRNDVGTTGNMPANTGELASGRTAEGSTLRAGTNSDIAGAESAGMGTDIAGAPGLGMGADDVGGMATGTGRGRGGYIGGGTYGSSDQGAGTYGDAASTSSMSGVEGSGGGLSSGTGGQGPARRSEVSGTGGGVAVSAGRGSDVVPGGGGMSDVDTNMGSEMGMSGGTMGGLSERDVGGGLSGGMRSGMGYDARGGMGGAGGMGGTDASNYGSGVSADDMASGESIPGDNAGQGAETTGEQTNELRRGGPDDELTKRDNNIKTD